MCKNLKKKLSMLFVVSLVALLSLSAFPGRYERTEAVVVEEPVLQEIPVDMLEEQAAEVMAPIIEETEAALEEILPPEPQPTSEMIADEGLQKLSEMLETYLTASKLSKDELTSLISDLETIKAEYEIIAQDAEEKESQIAALTVLNATQADDLAYIRGAYDKETKTKAYAKAGAVIGFEDLTPTWGLSAALGARFGKGFLLEAGVQYMLGTFMPGNLLYNEPSLDNLAITTSVGWEW